MNRFSQGSEEGRAPVNDGSATESSDLSSLFHYPSLGRLFDEPNNSALAEMRARLTRTHQALERVIRQGAQEDADRAARAARAYTATLTLLDNLEQLQRQTGK